MTDQASFGAGLNGQTTVFEVTGDVSKFLDSVQKTEIGVKRASKELEAAARAVDREIQALRSAEQPNRKMIEAKIALRKEIGLSIRELRAEGQALKENAKNMNLADKTVRDLRGNIQATIGPTALLVTALAAAGAAVAKSIQTFGNFERTLNTIKATTGATKDELNAIKESSLDLGAKTVFSNQQVAESYLNLSRSGFTVAEQLQAMPGLLDAAAASGGDLAQSASIVAGTLRGFGLEAGKAGHVADVLAKAANVADGEMSDFGDAFKQIGPVASSANQSMEDTAALLAILANNMIKGSDAGTDLKGILSRLVSPEQIKLIEQLGIKTTDAAGNIRPLIDIIIDFKKKFGELRKDAQLGLAVKIAGQENMKSMIALTNTSVAELEKMRGEFKNVDGSAKNTADTINQGVNTAFEQLGGSVEALTEHIGEGLGPTVINIINTFTDWINVINDVGTPLSMLIDQTLNLIGAFLQLNSMFDPLFIGFGSLSGSMQTGITWTDALGVGMIGLANIFDRVATFIRRTAIDIQATFDSVKSGIANTFATAEVQGQAQAAIDAKAKSAKTQLQKDLINRQKERTAAQFRIVKNRIESLSGINLSGGGKTNSKAPPPAGGTGGFDFGKDKKGRHKKDNSAAKLARAERDQLGDRLSALDNDLESSALSSRQRIADFGSSSDPDKQRIIRQKVLAEQSAELARQTAKNAQEQKALQGITYKTAEVEERRQQTIAKLGNKLKELKIQETENKTSMKELAEEIRKAEAEFSAFKRAASEDIRQANETAAIDSLKATVEAQSEELEKAYAKGSISADELASKQKELMAQVYAAEIQAIDNRAESLLKEAEFVTKGKESEKARIELNKKLNDLHNERNKLLEEQARKGKQIDEATKAEAEALTANFKQNFKSGLSEAIKYALTSGDIIGAVKKFGLSMRDILVDAIGNAISERITKGLGKVFDALGSFFAKLGKGGDAVGGGIGKALGGLSLAGGAAVAGGALVAAGGSYLANRSKGTLGQAAGVGLGVGGGALAGAVLGTMLFPGIGTLAGAALGGLAGGTAAVGSVKGTEGFFGKNKARIIGSILGGIPGFFIGNAIDKKRAQKARHQYQDTQLQPYLDNLVSGADPSNLADIQSRIVQASRGMPGRGSRGMEMKRAAMRELIAMRDKAVKDFIAEADGQIKDINERLAEAQAEPFKRSAMAFKYANQQLTDEFAKMRENYKDSQEAMTKITELETAKRAELQQGMADEFKTEAESLADLLRQRDEIANANVYERAKSAEQIKAEDLKAIDKQISQTALGINEKLALGVQTPNINGINRLLDFVRAGIINASFVINEATDADKVEEAIRRAMESLLNRGFGASAA
jgi:TP901 family phage tail tape measure protein